MNRKHREIVSAALSFLVVMVFTAGTLLAEAIPEIPSGTTIRVRMVDKLSSEDTEALVMCFETGKGSVFMNIAMRYNRRRKEERAGAVVG